MARDHALTRALPRDLAVVRFYRWARPTLSLGRNEPARGRFDAAEAEAAGVEVVRRPTGGRAVLHWRELTYAVVAPLESRTELRELYRRVHRGLVAGLNEMGVDARVAGSSGRQPGPDAGPCFGDAAEGEVVVSGRKLVGSAQVRIDGWLLQHGSLLLHDDQGLVDRLLVDRDPTSSRASAHPPRPMTLAECMPELPSCKQMITSLEQGLREALGGRWAPWDPDDEFHGACTRAEAPLLEHYRDPAWTWRR